jgi:hypothetical protein
MATLTLRLEVDPVTKKKNVWVKYDSDSDALPHEHEEEHKRLLKAVLGSGAVSAEDLGIVRVERDGVMVVVPQSSPEESAVPMKQKG